MTGEERRSAIETLLSGSDKPISAAELARRFSVSRQVIVGDVALMRASGFDVAATPRGYMLHKEDGGSVIRQVACVHSGEQTREELYIMVDNGCTAEDVIVEHPIYGQLAGQLQVSSRYDVDRFCEKLVKLNAPPLLMLTGGLHLHTLRCPDEAAYERVVSALRERGMLFEEKK